MTLNKVLSFLDLSVKIYKMRELGSVSREPFQY